MRLRNGGVWDLVLCTKAWSTDRHRSFRPVWLLGGWDGDFTPFYFCSAFLPPTAHSQAPRPFPEAPSPLPPRGPLACALRPTHFLCCPSSAPTPLGRKISLLKMGGSFSFPPGRPGRPSEWGRRLGSQASGQRGEVTRPQTPPRDRPGQLGKLPIAWGRIHTLQPPSRSPPRVLAPPAGGARDRTGQKPLSSRPRTKQSEHQKR